MNNKSRDGFLLIKELGLHSATHLFDIRVQISDTKTQLTLVILILLEGGFPNSNSS